MKLPFGLNINSYLELRGYAIEAELSPFYWTLYCKRAPEKGLTLLLRVGPFALFIYNLKKQDEWFNQLLEKETVEK